MIFTVAHLEYPREMALFLPTTAGSSAFLMASMLLGFTLIPPSMNTKDTELQFVLHRADERGHADHGWLNTYHSFSFAGWHDPKKMHFGALRVLNDDAVAGGGGFGTHPHDNMEIVSIPTSGALEHKDSMGNASVIKTGDVQIMSAGTGVRHSEFNHSATDPVSFFQVWIYPDAQGLTPRYDQEPYELAPPGEPLTCMVSPDGEAGVKIHQKAWFHMGRLNEGQSIVQDVHGAGQGLYIMVLEGSAAVAGQALKRRDAIGVWDTQNVKIEASSDCQVMVIEVPMLW